MADNILFTAPFFGEDQSYKPTTKGGYYLDEVRSSINKEIRRGREKEAFFWAYELYDSGMWRYLVRTLVTIAGEDVGMANPQIMSICMNAYLYFEHLAKQRGEKKTTKCKSCGFVEVTKGYYQPHWNELGLLLSLLCHSPKNRHVDYITSLTAVKRQKGWKIDVEEYSLDCHTERGRDRLKENNINPDKEFYGNGAKIRSYVPFNKRYEQEIKSELLTNLKLIEMNDVVEEIKVR
jgi:hypothetical protein